MRGLTLLFAFFILLISSFSVSGQEGFECSQSVFGFSQLDQRLYEIRINPSNVGLQFNVLFDDLDLDLEALAFHPSEKILYAIGIVDRALYKIDATGTLDRVNNLDLNPSNFYLAGEIHPSGDFYYLVESNEVRDINLVILNLQDYSIQRIPFDRNTLIRDICFDPQSNLLFAYDQKSEQMIRINNSGTGNFFLRLNPADQFQSIYSDAFGQIWAVGSTANGVASGLFKIDVENETYVRWTTGPESIISDVTACPYSSLMELIVAPENSLPCQELNVSIRLGNGGENLESIDLNLPMPEGFKLLELGNSSFDYLNESDSTVLSLKNIRLPKSIQKLDLVIESEDIPAGQYDFQGSIVSEVNGVIEEVISDNPLSVRPLDFSRININRIEEDTIREERFLCLGQGTLLDPSDYSSIGMWSNGFGGLDQEIFEAGTFTFNVNQECQEFSIQYDIVQASCPFTIALDHWIEPTEIVQCSEITYGYVFENSSGIAQNNISFEQELPEGFEFIELSDNPFGSEVVLDSLPNKIFIPDITMLPGFDTLEITLFVNESTPGSFSSRAKISGFPQDLGPFRFSDDPNTQEFDSTAVEVIGTSSDSLIVEVPFCNGGPTKLDGKPYGIEFLWPDNSRDSTFFATALGSYELKVFNGCKMAYVFFEVIEAIDIRLIGIEDIQIHQGQTASISTTIFNEGDSLAYFWESDLDIPCDDCMEFDVQPLEDAVYKFFASNEECSDSLIFKITVDQNRRLYFPTAFSPNRDGINDLFIFQSPDFTQVEWMRIYDRWGGQVYGFGPESTQGWNGMFKSKEAEEGVYFWQAKIKFVDGETGHYKGEVTLMR